MGLDPVSTVVGAVGEAAKVAGGFLERWWPAKMSEGEKESAKLELARLIDQRDRALLDTQKAVMVAELEQSDRYTKRARPTLLYAGLAFVFLVHVVFPMVSWWFGDRSPPPLELPEAFWWAWSGTAGLYVVGRTFDKKGGASLGQAVGQVFRPPS